MSYDAHVCLFPQTSLHVAASHVYEDIVELLLQSNAYTDAKDVSCEEGMIGVFNCVVM